MVTATSERFKEIKQHVTIQFAPMNTHASVLPPDPPRVPRRIIAPPAPAPAPPRLTPLPPKSGVSPTRRARLLRERHAQFEALCAGPGLPADLGPSAYLLTVMEGFPRDENLSAVILDWLGSPLSPPWHFNISDSNRRLYFINDKTLTALSEHPELALMRELCRLARAPGPEALEGKLLKYRQQYIARVGISRS